MGQRKGLKGNKGFSLIELIVAIAILAIVSVSIVLAMTSSSRSYSSMSVEAQLQSEAQLVANAISEIAIDASGASAPTGAWIASISGDADKFRARGLEYLLDDTLITENKDKAIILDATENFGSAAVEDYRKVQYIIARNNDNNIYMAKRSQDDTGAWEALENFSLLGNYISGFSVNFDRVDQDNLLKFELIYNKTDKTYKGNYQVLMRNRAYAKKNAPQPPRDEEIRIVTNIAPKIIYLAVKQGGIPEFYENATIDRYKKIRVDAGGNEIQPVKFKTTHVTNQPNGMLHSEWNLDELAQNSGVFRLEVETNNADVMGNPLTTDNALVITENADLLKNLSFDSFNVTYSESAQSDEGEIKSSQATICKVNILRIKSMTLRATSGFSTEWRDTWNGTKTDGVQGYAYSDTSGNIIDMNLNAAIDCTDWVPSKGGVSWKLEMDNGSGWMDCTNPNFARLVVTESESSTLNTVQFGRSAMNGQKYRITATSLFDPDFSSELIVGIAKSGDGNTDGFYSRGFYTDITSWLEREKGISETAARVTVTKSADWEGANVQIINGDDGRIYLYVNYDSFPNAMNEERMKFYDGSGTLTIQAYGATNNLLKDNVGQTALAYQMGRVLVTRVDPANQIVVVPKGASKNVKVKTSFYNLINRDYFGIFVDDMERNLNRPGMANSHKSISVETADAYGDLYNYAEQMSVSITPKTSMRDYNPYPMRLRLAALDYYNMSRNNREGGAVEYSSDTYADYIVYVANVKDADVFIPGPATTGDNAKVDNIGLTFPENVGTNKVSISGYDANGNVVNDIGKVYVNGNRTMLDYQGTTYTYSKTYHYWNK